MMTRSSLYHPIRIFIFISIILVLAPLVESIRARGSPNIILKFEGTKSSHAYPLHATESVTLWCAPDNNAVNITKASFLVAEKRAIQGEISDNGKNATYTIDHPTILDAGEYKCRLETAYGSVDHVINLYARPISHPHNSDTYEIVDGKDYHLEAPARGVEHGGSVNITCPVLGHPMPALKWTKDGGPLELAANVEVEGAMVRITNAEHNNSGVYTCTAVNEFAAGGKTSKAMLVVDKEFNIKGEFAWVVPLIVILCIFVLLCIIIFLCEIRRKRMEKRSNQYVVQE